MAEAPTGHEPSTKPASRWLERSLAAIIAILVLGVGGWYAVAYAFSPAAIRHPAHEHDHYRIILMNGGHSVNFGDNAFQTDYNKDMCTSKITKEPVHFHDNISQYGHLHWAGITGGLVLKNYGWNLIGGLPDTLGYRFDQGILPQRVPAHSSALPTPPAGASYYIYTGTATSHTKRIWSDFLHQPLTTFLNGTPVVDESESLDAQATDHERAHLNEVLGNVVIFVQKDAPTDAQVTAQFKTLKPLPESPCEG